MKDVLLPLRRLHGSVYEKKLERQRLSGIVEKLKNANASTIFFVLSPTHGNLGDHAIANASQKLIQKVTYDFIEITHNELVLLDKYKKLNVMNGHMIIVNGGGNLGTLWISVEMLFRSIITNNTDSSIICFPNTIYYEETDFGQKELLNSIKVYNGHKDLLICAREQISYNMMKDIYKDVILVPDLALSLNECKDTGTVRKGCIICLRNDIEKTLHDSEKDKIIKIATDLFGNITFSDMNINKNIYQDERQIELERKFDEFRSSEVVITDRLHGMIFAAITGTPCVVINSKSPKVKGSYEWIKDLGYIGFCDNLDNLGNVCSIVTKSMSKYDNSSLDIYYKELVDRLKDKWSKDWQGN